MSVEDDLLKIKEIKKSLNTAIRAKGSDIADDTKFDQYPQKIDGIEIGSKEVATYKIDENGTLSPAEVDLSGRFDNVKIIKNHGLSYMFNQAKIINNITDFTFPELTTIESGGMEFAFTGSPFSSISFPKLTTIDFQGMYNAFLSSEVSQISFPELELVGDNGMQRAFDANGPRAGKLASINFPKLREVGRYGMASAFKDNNKNLSSANFPELTKIGEYGFQSIFEECEVLENCNFPKLQELGQDGMSRAFYSCQSLSKISFPSLSNVGTSAFGRSSSSYAFSYCNYLTEIHFPAAIQSTIEALTGYSDKWGARKAVVYFDL